MEIPSGDHTILSTNKTLKESNKEQLGYSQIYITLLIQSILGLPSLQYRRPRGGVILLYRLVNNDIGIDFADFFTVAAVTYTRSHMYKLYKPRAILISFQPDLLIVRLYNLPDYVVTAQSLNEFKSLLIKERRQKSVANTPISTIKINSYN